MTVGLLERPVVLTTGKREKKKVERLSMSINLPNADRKKVDIQEGAGTKLGDCPRSKYCQLYCLCTLLLFAEMKKCSFKLHKC